MQKVSTSVFNVEQIRLLERVVIEELGISGSTLMRRAGEAVVARVQQNFPQAQRFVVFCGTGNNAGDGFVIAQLLRAFSKSVTVYVLQNVNNFKGDALAAYQQYVDGGGRIDEYRGLVLPDCDLIIDAILGTGQSRPAVDAYLTAITQINQAGVPVIAVDIPSGMHADTGKAWPIAIKAAMTVTLIGLKQGLCTGDAAEYRGELVLDTLALPESIYQYVPASVVRVQYLPMSKRNRCSHKGHYGHVLVIGGELGYSGAVMLAAEAALRVGSGLVSIATRVEHAAVLNLQRPELMCHGITDINQLQILLLRSSVVVIGPGLGQSAWAEEMLHLVLAQDKTIVIDADALNLMAKIAIENKNSAAWILTPHPGEAGRLLNCSTAQIEQNRFVAVRSLREKYIANIVLKGAGTLLADTEGVAVVLEGNPGMASGGMGDVLSGVIAGLAAQGMSIANAMRQGVCLHAMAADRAVLKAGERGLLASDLMPYLRQLVN